MLPQFTGGARDRGRSTVLMATMEVPKPAPGGPAYRKPQLAQTQDVSGNVLALLPAYSVFVHPHSFCLCSCLCFASVSCFILFPPPLLSLSRNPQVSQMAAPHLSPAVAQTHPGTNPIAKAKPKITSGTVCLHFQLRSFESESCVFSCLAVGMLTHSSLVGCGFAFVATHKALAGFECRSLQSAKL